jgi:hypothetical protein
MHLDIVSKCVTNEMYLKMSKRLVIRNIGSTSLLLIILGIYS